MIGYKNNTIVNCTHKAREVAPDVMPERVHFGTLAALKCIVDLFGGAGFTIHCCAIPQQVWVFWTVS